MLDWFAETTLVAAGLALVASLASRTPRLGPAAKHTLWLLVLAKLFTPPIVHWPWPMPMASLRTVGSHTVAEHTRPQDVANAEPAVRAPVTVESWVVPTHGETRFLETAHQVPAPMEGERIALGAWLLPLWLALSVLLAAEQTRRILRFRRRLRGAVSAPGWLVDETERLSAQFGVRVPEALVIPGVGTPMLWCLGRPKLLLPESLVRSLGIDRWRGVLAHELAHLRRGDPWFSRLALIAGLVWWWNPIYWLARRRLDAEAELACDAWVAWALPGERLRYAETLFEICASLSPVGRTSPALGVAGSGRFFERRLTMVVQDQVPHRLSAPGLLAAGLLAALALPSWTAARPIESARPSEVGSSAVASTAERPAPPDADEEDDDDDDDDDRDRDRGRKAEIKPRRKADKPAERRTDKKSDRAHSDQSRGSDSKDLEALGPEIEKLLNSVLGPGSEFQKQMEQLGPKIEAELRKKLGPDFEKRMEKLGKSMEDRFGPDFEKRMEEFGKSMEKRFGPGSDFEKHMGELGKSMEKSFGPGSDFDTRLKNQFGSDSEKRLKESTKPKPRREAANRKKPPTEKSEASRRSRDERIKALERQIDQLRDELKRLKVEEDEGENLRGR